MENETENEIENKNLGDKLAKSADTVPEGVEPLQQDDETETNSACASASGGGGGNGGNGGANDQSQSASITIDNCYLIMGILRWSATECHGIDP